ncbi:hypothetical protein ACS5PJ_01305 [Pseudarthrobacter sp. YS3]|uniref:hypothetical protein n=1 Tax=Pseudarthrobacter sp. YS3 TaxID=3453718 RepID=UPI003EEFBD32
MSDLKPQRRAAVLNLVELRTPLPAALKELATYPWDSVVAYVELNRGHLLHGVSQYLAGILTGSELVLWAETVQGRDDIALNDEDRDLLAQALFELSSPELFGSIDQISSVWQAKLR